MLSPTRARANVASAKKSPPRRSPGSATTTPRSVAPNPGAEGEPEGRTLGNQETGEERGSGDERRLRQTDHPPKARDDDE